MSLSSASFPVRSVLDGFPAQIVGTLDAPPDRPSWALSPPGASDLSPGTLTAAELTARRSPRPPPIGGDRYHEFVREGA
jgi:hypothetical protein